MEYFICLSLSEGGGSLYKQGIIGYYDMIMLIFKYIKQPYQALKQQ